MVHRYRDLAFTPAVRAAQAENHSREAQEADAPGPVTNAALGESEAIFLSQCRSLFLGTVSETGWPYIQHRGGPAGFVRVLAPDLIGWAEFAGNRQYVSTGNLAGNTKVSLFVVDYARRARLKILGEAELIGTEDPRLAELAVEGYPARVERGMLIRVAGFDWNCPQHIPQLFTVEQVEAASRKMLDRIAELEAELAAKS